MRKIVIVLLIFFLSCDKKNKALNLKTLEQFPKKLKEISGIAFNGNLLYTIEDSGNKNYVTVLNLEGEITKVIAINNVNNIDWEDLTFDTSGNLYIGDFGNNENTRKDLVIYKIDSSNLQKERANVAYKVFFDFPEQTDFPPKKNNLKYDVEAFFEFQNYFYLFTKNRSSVFDGTSYIYRIPNTLGSHHAQLMKTISTCTDYNNCVVTGASISPDGSKFVLLSHSKIWLFENYYKNDITNGTMTELNLDHNSQKEAVCFKNNDILLIADERVKNSGGNLYQVELKSLIK